ncbi:MAG TPA: dephospho-CoA kinase [Bacteroidales bacterium]|nr:dephospho-CoA kinase [Bacteroidales bacterium]
MNKYGMKIGVTGGIGSGKTTVCRIFSALGIPVFAADIDARNVMETEPEVIEKVNQIAGRDVYRGGDLNRSELAAIIFNDRELLEEINATVHPVVRRNFESWQRTQDTDYVILEAAILFESASFRNVDRIITVIAPVEERIDRVVKRNNLSREQVGDRIKNQYDDDYKVARSHYVIDNSDNRLIIPEVLRIHQDILEQINLRKKNG